MDYVNYIREYDEKFSHPLAGSARIVSAWREVYRVSTATPPEEWARGRFLPDGHTVTVSDMYFIAHFVGLMRSVVGAAAQFDASGVTLSGGDRVEASIVIKAVGFELNEGNERILGRARVHGGCMADDGVWTIVNGHPDGKFSGGSIKVYINKRRE